MYELIFLCTHDINNLTWIIINTGLFYNFFNKIFLFTRYPYILPSSNFNRQEDNFTSFSIRCLGLLVVRCVLYISSPKNKFIMDTSTFCNVFCSYTMYPVKKWPAGVIMYYHSINFEKNHFKWSVKLLFFLVMGNSNFFNITEH